MSDAKEILVVGATGVLGTEVVRVLKAAGHPVRALVRETAPPEKRAQLEALGARLVAADLKDRKSLDAACKGISTIVSTASATLSRQEGDSIESVDEVGHLSLIQAAEDEHVEHFVFVSFPETGMDFALERAKRAVEARLRTATPTFTVIQPAFFIETWLSAYFGFDPAHGTARLLGNGDGKVSWVSLQDAARFVAAAAEGGRYAGQVITLGGPDPLSQRDVIAIFEELGSPKVSAETPLPESALEGMLAAAQNPIEEAFASLMLCVARGLVVDPRPAQALLPGRLVTVRDYALRLLNAPN